MGWLSGWDSKRELIAHLRDEFREDGPSTYRIVRDSTVGNHFWFVAEHKQSGERSIGLCLLRGGHRDTLGLGCGPWGYKDMSESAGPYYYDCPLAFLKLAPVVANAEWREEVVAYHQRKNRVFAIGERVSLPDGYNPQHFVVTSDKPLRGRQYQATAHDLAPYGREYRLPRLHIIAPNLMHRG